MLLSVLLHSVLCGQMVVQICIIEKKKHPAFANGSSPHGSVAAAPEQIQVGFDKIYSSFSYTTIDIDLIGPLEEATRGNV